MAAVGTIRHARSGWAYTITSEDVLWLARALWGEGGTRPDAVAWTLAQRFAVLRNSGLFRSFGAYIRAYSQPVNPAWRLGGERCPRPVPGTDCDPAKLARRAEIATARWDQIPEEDRRAALAFARGRVRNPVPGAMHWAIPERVERTHLAEDPQGEILLAESGNAFFVPSRFQHWRGIEVTVSGADAFRASGAPGSLFPEGPATKLFVPGAAAQGTTQGVSPLWWGLGALLVVGSAWAWMRWG